MKTLLFIWSGRAILFFALLAGFACTDEENAPALQLELITASGAAINPNGEWVSGCVTDLGKHVSEIFIFDEATITLDIQQYDDGDCSNPIGQEQVSINAKTDGTYEAILNGETVLANKLSGTQSRQNGSETSEFRQGLYVDDSGDRLQFYHGRFGDDGGEITEDGYPLEMIPIIFQKK